MSAREIDMGEMDGSAPLTAPAASRRRALVLGAAAATFICIFMLRELTIGAGDDLDDALGLLYVLPVALVALELGLRAGLTAALGVVAVIAVSTVAQGHDLDPAALLVRSLIFLMSATLAGMFTDRMRACNRLEELRQVALRNEVQTTRRRLNDHLRNAGDLLAHQERERREIAVQLHEEAAQTLAAALLTVGVLERGADGAAARRELKQVRTHVRACIADLRRIADTLRPAVLDEMGLAAALARIAEVEAERGVRRVAFSTESLPSSLPREVETSTYRLLEELLEALAGAASVDVALAVADLCLRVSLEVSFERSREMVAQGLPETLESRLIAARVRAELLGGSIDIHTLHAAGGIEVVAQLPLGGG